MSVPPLLLLLLSALPSLAGGRGGAPAFAPHQQTAVVAPIGESAALRCGVLRLADRTVSWVRSSDLQILTHAGMVFTADSRVSCSGGGPDTLDLSDVPDAPYAFASDAHEPQVTVHTLHIARLRLSDSGRYECQINTEPKLSLFFNLTVIESSLPTVEVSVLEGDVIRGTVGGAARLSCEARYVQSPGSAQSPALPPAALAALQPLALRWEHNGETLNPQSPRGAISLETERWTGRVVSRLTLASLTALDAGSYTCVSADARAHLALRLRRHQSDERDYDIIDAEMEMQRDQAVARVSAASTSRAFSFAAVAVLAVLFSLRSFAFGT